MRRLLLGLLFSAWASLASAGVTCTLPFNLQNNTTADATQVMANYNALVTCLTNAAHAGANSDITALTGLTTPITPAEGGSSVYIGGTSGGATNAQTVASPVPLGFALTTGNQIVFVAGFSNTAAMTLNVNSTGALSVFKPTPAGPVALVGGEIRATDIVVAIYDGTQYQIKSIASETGGFGPTVTTASASTADLALSLNHNAVISGSVTIQSFGSNASTSFPTYRVVFTGAPLLTYNGTSMILPGAADIQAAAGDTAVVDYLGSGNWRVSQYQKATGGAVVAGQPPPASFSNLVIKVTGTTTASATADFVTVYNSSNLAFTAPLSASLDLGSNGSCNKLDAGTIAVNTWYNIFAISNGSTTCGLVSTSATAPTMPSGYTYKARIGAIQTINASATLYGTWQFGKNAVYKLGLAQTTILPLIESGAKGTYSNATPTWSSPSLARFVPPTAVSATFMLSSGYNSGTSSTMQIAPTTTYGGYISTKPPPFDNAGVSFGSNFVTITLEASTISWTSSNTGGALMIYGWTDNL